MSADEYDESRLNACHSDAGFFNGERLTSPVDTRASFHRHPQTPSYPDDLTDEYDSSSEGSVVYDGRYPHTDNGKFPGSDGSRLGASDRPRGPPATNREFCGTADRHGSRPNADRHHDGRRRVIVSSTTESEDDRPCARDPVDRHHARTGFASGADHGTGQGGTQARGSNRDGRDNRGDRAPPDNRRTSRASIISPSAEPASSHVKSAAGEGHRVQRKDAPSGSAGIPRRRARFQDSTGRHEEPAEDAATAEVNRRFRSMKFSGS